MSDSTTAADAYEQLFAFTDQLLSWLSESDPRAYQAWAPHFVELDGHDCGPSDGLLLAAVASELSPRERASLVLHFVDDPAAAALWWHEHIHPEGLLFDEDGYSGIVVDFCEVGFHPSDQAKNPHGASTVAYWPVASLDATRNRLLDAGCEPLRGPLDIEAGRSICQLRDPHGIVFGLEGPR